MRRRVLLASLCLAWCFLFSWRSSVCPQETPEKTKPKPNPIEGEWIEICRDRAGHFMSMLPELRPAIGQMGLNVSYVWKITKETIDMGPDEKDRFPQYRYTYKLNPGGQADALDLNLEARDLYVLDKTQRRKIDDKHRKQTAIYFVKGDYLMICIGGDARPKSFTSSKDNPTMITILRRGKLGDSHQDATTPKPK